MKIAYLSYSAVPSRMANSVHVMKMCSALAGLGHEVRLFIPDRKSEIEPEAGDVFAYYGVERNFEIERLPWPEIRFRSLAFMAAIFLRVPRWNPDRIYSRYLFGCAALAMRNRNSVFETHAPAWEEGAIHGLCLRALLFTGKVRAIVCISDALRAAYAKHGYRPRNGILLARDAADGTPDGGVTAALPSGHPRLRVGYIGQLYQGKGMEVVAAIARHLPDFDFHVVGGYPSDIAAWKARVSSGNVRFHGFVPPVQVGSWIEAMDICLLPNQRTVRSFSSRKMPNTNISEYTSPLKLFEYMAHGKAIVCSRLPVLQEVLGDSHSLFADPDKPEEWISALEDLREPSLRARIGEAAKAAFLKNHSWRSRASIVASEMERMTA